MTDLVLDASVALSWCFKNEATATADRVLERLATEAASVPGHMASQDRERVGSERAPRADHARKQQRIYRIA